MEVTSSVQSCVKGWPVASLLEERKGYLHERVQIQSRIGDTQDDERLVKDPKVMEAVLSHNQEYKDLAARLEFRVSWL